MKKILLPSLLFTLSLSLPSYAASFDCAKAASWTEQMICGDAPLSRMDDQMAVAYKQASDVVPDKNILKATQLAWIKKQRACQDILGLRDLYTARLNELSDLTTKASPSSLGKSDGSVAEPVKNSSESLVKKLLTFKLVYGEPLPLCQPYVDMLNATKYVGYSELACERKILPRFPQFKAINWIEIADKNEMEKILTERIEIDNIPLGTQELYVKKIQRIVETIRNDKLKLYFFKDDLDKDGIEDIAYKTVQIDPNADEATACKMFSISYFDDKKTTAENAKQRYPSPYLSFRLSANDELFYFKEAIYSSSWGDGIISANSNLDIYGVGNKKICGILAK